MVRGAGRVRWGGAGWDRAGLGGAGLGGAEWGEHWPLFPGSGSGESL